jgi:hypothetical protein
LCICPQLTRQAGSNAEPLVDRLLRDEVDQPVRDENRALNTPLAQAALYVRAAQGALLGFGLIDAGWHLDAITQPSVNLHHHRDLGPAEE